MSVITRARKKFMRRQIERAWELAEHYHTLNDPDSAATFEFWALETKCAGPQTTDRRASTMKTADETRWFYFCCERCGRDSNADGFLLDGDYSDCYPCDDCEQDVPSVIVLQAYPSQSPESLLQQKQRMTFRPATTEEKLRLKKEKLENLWSFD